MAPALFLRPSFHLPLIFFACAFAVVAVSAPGTSVFFAWTFATCALAVVAASAPGSSVFFAWVFAMVSASAWGSFLHLFMMFLSYFFLNCLLCPLQHFENAGEFLGFFFWRFF